MTKIRETLRPGDKADTKKSIELDIVVDYSSTPAPPPEISTAAIRAVAERATDADDARMLLETLGLIEPAATSVEAPSDCEPAMPRTLPFAVEVNAYIDQFNGRYISNVPTGGLL